MKKLSIDRFDGKFAICKDSDNLSLFAIYINELPNNAEPGDILIIDDMGNISIDEIKTEKAKKK